MKKDIIKRITGLALLMAVVFVGGCSAQNKSAVDAASQLDERFREIIHSISSQAEKKLADETACLYAALGDDFDSFSSGRDMLDSFYAACLELAEEYYSALAECCDSTCRANSQPEREALHSAMTEAMEKFYCQWEAEYSQLDEFCENMIRQGQYRMNTQEAYNLHSELDEAYRLAVENMEQTHSAALLIISQSGHGGE